MALHIINHDYHLNNIEDKNAKVIIIGNFSTNDKRVVGKYRLYESCGLISRLFSNHLDLIYKKICKISPHDECIFFWGLQDKLSNDLSKLLVSRFEIKVVPDNIEFFLRCKSKGSKPLRAFIKSLTYQEGRNFLFGETGVWCNRFTYTLPKGIPIDHNNAFYNSRTSNQIIGKSDGITFISQPYYVDFDINFQKWTLIIKEIINELKLEFNYVNIKFHQRDTNKFKNFIGKCGIEEANDTEHCVAGFFSTLLFEKALNGNRTYLFIDKLRNTLPKEYFGFSDWIITNLIHNYDPSKPINLKNNAFHSLPFFLE